MREGCWRRLSTSSGFTGAMRGFLLNQEDDIEGRQGVTEPGCRPSTRLHLPVDRLELEALAELEHPHRQARDLALQLGHERRLEVVEQHLGAVALELPQLGPERPRA